MTKEDFVSVAKILGFHGINGEVRVGYTKGHEAILKGAKSFFMKKNDDFVEFPVSSVRFHKKYMLVKFTQFNSINDVQAFQNCFLFMEKSKFDSLLEKDEYLVTDLIGMEVFSKNDEFIGKIDNVDSNGATDILSVKFEDKNYFIPFVKELVPVVDIERRKVLVNDIEGLLE